MRWTEAADIVFGLGRNNRRSIGQRRRYRCQNRTFRDYFTRQPMLSLHPKGT